MLMPLTQHTLKGAFLRGRKERRKLQTQTSFKVPTYLEGGREKWVEKQGRALDSGRKLVLWISLWKHT